MPELKKLNLILFFTRGVSLRIWDKIGMLGREVALYRRLQGHGVKITFVTYGDSSDMVYSSRFPGITILCNRWRLNKTLYELCLPWLHGLFIRRADVIKTNQTFGADVALRAAQFWHKPLIARGGYMWSNFEAKGSKVSNQGLDPAAAALSARNVETRVFNAAKKVIVTTPMMAADIARRIPEVAGHTVVIPNYVETERFKPANEVVQDYDVMFVGRISHQKNVGALLKAVKPLDVRVMLIGKGELRDELQKHYASLNSRVHWLGNIPSLELPSYMNRASIFILPSLYEGHPKVLLEAMACGLPVIGADSPGIRELIRHGETGWLCGTDPESIRAAIQKLLVHPELCARLGQNARQFVLENFALDRIVELELAVLREVVTE